MKRLIFATLFLSGFTIAVSAQSGTGSSSTTTGSASSTAKKPNSKKEKPTEKLNNRKIYHFENGQRSTPTGHEATASGVGGGYAALGKNNASTAKSDTVANPGKVSATKQSAARNKSRKNSKQNH